MNSLRRTALLLTLLSCAALTAGAVRSDQPSSLGVFSSPDGVQKTTTINPGSTANVYVMTDRVGLFPGDGLGGAQFRVQVDPRLVVLSKTPSPNASISFEVAPDEWVLGFGTCQPVGPTSLLLMTYTVFLPADAVDPADLRVEVGDLGDQPMAWTRCAGEELRRLYSSGGALLNPSSPSIVHLSGSPQVVVQGRDLSLAWESFGAASATLDGVPVPPSGNQILQPIADHAYLLQVDGGPTAQFAVDVIQEPRVDSFRAELIGAPSTTNPVRLSWEVRGADEIFVQGLGSGQPAIGSARVALLDPALWQLDASNEWGNSSTIAVLEGAAESPPIVISFRAEPAQFRTGESVEIFWSIWNADSASIDPLIGSVDPLEGSTILQPTDDTTLTLTATNVNGTTTRTLDLVLLAPTIVSFVVDPLQVYAGRDVAVSWDVVGATSLSISPDIGPLAMPSGSTVYTPASSVVELILSAENAKGVVTATRTVQWIPPHVELSASTLTPFGGFDFDLVAVVEGADSASLDPLGPITPENQTISTQVTAPTTFTLQATNAQGSSQSAITVTPQAPALALSADDTTPFGEQQITLDLKITGATTASLVPGYPDLVPQDQTITLTILEDTIFTLVAYNATGSSQVQLSIDAQVPELSLEADRNELYGGESVHLTAVIAGASSATLSPAPGAIPATGGQFDLLVDTTTSFVLEAANSAGVSQATVEVVALPPLASLNANKLTPYANEMITLTVGMQGATSATLEPGFGAIAPGGGYFSVVVPQPTIFQLAATNPAGTTIAEVAIDPKAPEVVGPTYLHEPDLIGGESTTLEWHFAGADLVTIEPLGFSTTENGGTLVVSPTATTTYVVTASNAVGSRVVELTANVRGFRIAEFAAVPNSILLGTSAELRWTVEGIADVELVGFGAQPLSGSMTVLPVASTSYTLLASDGIDSDSRTITLTVYDTGHNELHLASQPDGSGQVLYLDPFVPTPMYAVVTRIDVPMAGWEFSLGLPPCVFLIGTQLYPAESINIATPPNYIVGMGGCFFGYQPLLLARFDLLATEYCSGEITVEPAEPSSFSPPLPIFATCGNELATFAPIVGILLAGGVPVLQVELDVEAREGGLLSRWNVPHGGENLQSLRVERSRDGEPPRVVHHASVAELASGSWLDRDALPGVAYRYQAIASVDGVEQRSEIVIGKWNDVLPQQTLLLPNVPNPFNPSTHLRFRLAEAGDALLAIYDLGGREIYRRTFTGLGAGEHEHLWNAIDSDGRPIASGVYVVRLTTARGVDTQRVALLK